MVTDIQDYKDGYDGGGDVGEQKKIFGTTEMEKWVGRTGADWANM